VSFVADEQIRRVPVTDDRGTVRGIVAQPDIATRDPDKRERAEVVGKIPEPT
jgi:hypothetical protein